MNNEMTDERMKRINESFNNKIAGRKDIDMTVWLKKADVGAHSSTWQIDIKRERPIVDLEIRNQSADSDIINYFVKCVEHRQALKEIKELRLELTHKEKELKELKSQSTYKDGVRDGIAAAKGEYVCC